MAESMAGLKRSHRCTELGTANIGEPLWAGFRRAEIKAALFSWICGIVLVSCS